MMVLRHLATSQTASASEIAEAASTSRSTAYRLAERLTSWGFLQPDSAPGRWTVGPEGLRLGLAALARSNVAHVAPEPLRHLADLTQETAGLAIAVDATMIFVHREPGPRPSPVSTRVGATRPVHSTAVGKAWLAALEPVQLRAMLRRVRLAKQTPATIVTRADLERDLDLTRRRGWSIDHGEMNPATAACGAVVRDQSGAAIAAISVSGPVARVNRSLDRLGPVVAQTADLISRRLGQHSHTAG